MRNAGAVRAVVLCLLVLTVSLGWGCGLNPASPEDVDVRPFLDASPGQPFKSFERVTYGASLTLINPSVGMRVILRPIECSVIGPDGSTYGTYRERVSTILEPGMSVSSSVNLFTDTNASRPVATRYTCFTSYYWTSGDDRWLEAGSTFLPLR